MIEGLHRILPRYAYDNEPNAISRQPEEAHLGVRDIVLDHIGGDHERGTVIYTQTATAPSTC